MRLTPLLAQSAFIALAAFGFWEIIISSGHPTKGTGLAQLAKPVCDPLQSGHFSANGIKLTWFGQKGGIGCKLVNVFQTALSPHHGHISPSTPPLRTFMVSFLATLPSLITVLHLSSFHLSAPSLLPTAFEISYQLFSAGAIIPLFASLGVWFSPARESGSGARKLRSLEVEGLIFAILVGAAYPSFKIAFDDNQNWTMAWQFFPVAVWVLQKVYVISGKVIGGRRESEGARSPKNALRVIYGISAGSSLVAHLPIVYRAYTSPTPFFQSIAAIYIPASLVPTPLSLTGGIHRLLQYDLIVAFVALLAVLTYRLRQPLLESASFVMMIAQLTLAGGPGFGLMAAWWWVEERGWSET